MFPSTFLATAALLSSLLSSQVAANWDPATGYIYDVRPTCEWQAKNQPAHTTQAIQVAECYSNTRLHFPEVQLFAWFKVRHECDHYHGCPYGDCLAYTTFPQPDELEVDFTNSDVFFWHDTGGVPGPGPNPIANPQTGGFGYESSLDGVFHDGKVIRTTEQIDHDSNYPGFKLNDLQKWSITARELYASLRSPGYPKHPKCGLAEAKNTDPGSVPGAYGHYIPAPASQYRAPRPYPGTQVHNSVCSSNASTTVPPPQKGNHTQTPIPKHHGHHGCTTYCKCIAGCSQGEASCVSNCQNKHPSCSSGSCQAVDSSQTKTASQPVSHVRRHAKRAALH